VIFLIYLRTRNFRSKCKNARPKQHPANTPTGPGMMTTGEGMRIAVQTANIEVTGPAIFEKLFTMAVTELSNIKGIM